MVSELYFRKHRPTPSPFPGLLLNHYPWNNRVAFCRCEFQLSRSPLFLRVDIYPQPCRLGAQAENTEYNVYLVLVLAPGWTVGGSKHLVGTETKGSETSSGGLFRSLLWGFTYPLCLAGADVEGRLTAVQRALNLDVIPRHLAGPLAA